MSIQERIAQFNAGLITRAELESAVSIENMGSDYYFYQLNFELANDLNGLDATAEVIATLI